MVASRVFSAIRSGRSAIVALAAAVVLAGCNTGSVTDGLTPTAQMRQVPPADIQGETALAPQIAAPAGPDAALATGGTAAPAGAKPAATQQASLGSALEPVSFLPVTGAPQSAVTSLATSMRQAAKNEKVPVVVSIEQGAKFQIKGYFSALNDGNGTILVYVWDVLDSSGARVHRISGQERSGGSTGDPWVGIKPDVYTRVADITMSSLRTLMTTRGNPG
ncbi:MAG TPA: hypothetical protein VLQ68_02635 [Rhizobiaceae bacterium]|nr:hypothetical protein [Rhizobiaceae bacterium]